MKRLINTFLGQLGYRIERRTSKKDIILQTQKKLVSSTRRKIVFDVGAYTGETAVGYHQLFDGHCDIYAFEPFKASFDRLVESTAAYPNIKTFNKAIGDQKKEVAFSVNSFAATNSMLETDTAGYETWGEGLLETQERIKVPMICIDDFVNQHQINQIDILKLDTQGTEPLVLEGAKEVIRKGNIKVILSELIVMPTYKGQKELHELLAIFKHYGFELYNLYPSLSSKGQLRFLDGIFVHHTVNK